MKQLFTLILMMAYLAGFSQTDSSKQKVSITLQARDWAYLTNFMTSDEVYEDLYDSIKVRFRVTTPPSGTTSVTVPGIETGVLYGLFQFVRGINYSGLQVPFKRINTALRAPAHGWLTRKLDELDAAEQERYQTLIKIGNQRLKRSF